MRTHQSCTAIATADLRQTAWFGQPGNDADRLAFPRLDMKAQNINPATFIAIIAAIFLPARRFFIAQHKSRP
ncbi:hypothetical protein V8J88_14100 [Massilia sp. W12]|uniref:hypothetical protein n=1 Tax=Massilia sp. W12 TaxID=3126507 RepID=UPI0030D08B97